MSLCVLGNFQTDGTIDITFPIVRVGDVLLVDGVRYVVVESADGPLQAVREAPEPKSMTFYEWQEHAAREIERAQRRGD